MNTPVIYMLCGLTGSGKTTYARELEKQEYKRLALDEEVHALVEKDGYKYPDMYLEYEPKAKANLERQLKDLISSGKNCVLDYGFWKKSDRDYYKQIISDNGGIPKLLYFKTAPEVLMNRLHQRNAHSGANALTVTEEMLQDFIARFEEPNNESEDIIEANE